MGQGTHKKLRIIHEFELYKFELDKYGCILELNVNDSLP